MSVFRLKYYVNEYGKRVSKTTVGARSQASTKYYGEYRDEHGRLKRVPLHENKKEAERKLFRLKQEVEQFLLGRSNPYAAHGRRPLSEHLHDYQQSLMADNNTATHVEQVRSRVKRIAAGCKFTRITEIDSHSVKTWLAHRRQTNKRFSVQTSNHYQTAFNAFCNWLVSEKRLPDNPLASLKRLHVDADTRHDRRPLSEDEFVRLIAAAESGAAVEGLLGTDRAMLYIVASWTGARRRELSSLTQKSLDLDSENPAIEVRAGYSKRRRKEWMPLHLTVVERLRGWLATKKLSPSAPLFELKTVKSWRKTSKMMRLDLSAARDAWLTEAKSVEEREARAASDFLVYQSEDGLFADFHSHRHSFVSRLGRSGVPLMTAQKLARHSDARLTTNIYDHREQAEKSAAINGLPGLQLAGSGSIDAVKSAVIPDKPCPLLSTADGVPPVGGESERHRKSLEDKDFGDSCLALSTLDEVHPEGFEPPTLGSEDRCSIQLSYGCLVIEPHKIRHLLGIPERSASALLAHASLFWRSKRPLFSKSERVDTTCFSSREVATCVSVSHRGRAAKQTKAKPAKPGA